MFRCMARLQWSRLLRSCPLRERSPYRFHPRGYIFVAAFPKKRLFRYVAAERGGYLLPFAFIDGHRSGAKREGRFLRFLWFFRHRYGTVAGLVAVFYCRSDYSGSRFQRGDEAG